MGEEGQRLLRAGPGIAAADYFGRTTVASCLALALAFFLSDLSFTDILGLLDCPLPC